MSSRLLLLLVVVVVVGEVIVQFDGLGEVVGL